MVDGGSTGRHLRRGPRRRSYSFTARAAGRSDEPRAAHATGDALLSCTRLPAEPRALESVRRSSAPGVSRAVSGCACKADAGCIGLIDACRHGRDRPERASPTATRACFLRRETFEEAKSFPGPCG